MNIDITPRPHPMLGPPAEGPGGEHGVGVGGGDINIHIDINMNIDIHIIINMNIEYYIEFPSRIQSFPSEVCYFYCPAWGAGAAGPSVRGSGGPSAEGRSERA